MCRAICPLASIVSQNPLRTGLNNLTLLLSRTGLWAVQDNNKVKLFRPSLGLLHAEAQDWIPTRAWIYKQTMSRLRTRRHTQTHTHTHIQTHARSRRLGFARIKNSQHMSAAVCGQPLYIAMARFVWGKKCRMGSCIDLSSSQQMNRSQPMER